MPSHRSSVQGAIAHPSEPGSDGVGAAHPSRGRCETISRGGFAARPTPRRLAPPARPQTSCPVCRCTSVTLDEVHAGEPLRLAECPRCEHRWTAHARVGGHARATGRVGRAAFVTGTRLDVVAQA